MGNAVTQVVSATTGGRGIASRSTLAPQPLGSRSIASEPSTPAMLTSRAARQIPSSASAGRTRTSSASRPPRSADELK